MSKAQSTTREDRAAALIEQGAVRLHPGEGTATVKGRTGTYTITKRDGCNCPDARNRGSNCYHALAARQLCQMYRECAKQARETGQVRLPVELMKALGGVGTDEPAPESWSKPLTYCKTCGSALVKGMCGAVGDWEARRQATYEALTDDLFGAAA